MEPNDAERPDEGAPARDDMPAPPVALPSRSAPAPRPEPAPQPEPEHAPAPAPRRPNTWRRTWRGATLAVLVYAFVILAAAAFTSFAVPSPNWTGLAALGALVAASFAAGLLLALLVRGLAALPFTYAWAAFSAVGLLAFPVMGPLGLRGAAAQVLATLLLATLTGAAWGTLRHGRAARPSLAVRVFAGLGVALGLAATAAAGAWLVWPGRPAEPVTAAVRLADRPLVEPLVLADPAQPGRFHVHTLTYGSGSDLRRPEYGAQAALRTRPVDGSRLVGRWSGRAGDARTRYWGFDARALPLQGRVWYPEGTGPFPLVLGVHGNHTAEDFSDAGYAYLGELLASRGFIFVSADQNFLNGALVDVLGFPDFGLEEETDLRAFLLLEHLRQWRAWNAGEGGRFHGRVDLERVALLGHSRGGEAVAVAAAFNRLPFYPDDATLAFDYGFGLRGIVAVAPIDGQYRPAGTRTLPRNVDYLVLHGSQDGDVRSYHGARVFERVAFDDGHSHFKAGVWVHGANHGQFNTTWGRNDTGGLQGGVLRRAAILPAADQRRVAQVFVSAFLEASLRGAHGYRALFRDRRAGHDWLPEGVYLQQYSDTDVRVVAGFDEDIDVTTATLPGASIAAAGLADWKEREVEIKRGTLDTRGVFVGWDTRGRGGDQAAAAAPPPVYTLRLPEQDFGLGAGSVLSFHVADSGRRPTRRDASGRPLEDAQPPAAPDKQERAPIDFTVELRDRAGVTARVALARAAPVQPRVEAQVTKLPALDETQPAEPVLALRELPLRLFTTAEPALDLAQLAEVRFVFDRTPAAVLIFDHVGFRVPPPDPALDLLTEPFPEPTASPSSVPQP